MKDEGLHAFRKAKLQDCNGDLKKRWYIIFYVWDVQKNALVRKRDYSINNYKTIDERKAFAKQSIKSINELLAEGYHIDIKKKSEVEIDLSQTVTLETALKQILEIKKQTIRPSSFYSFSSTLERFLIWAKTNHLASSDIACFDRLQATRFVDALIIEENLTGKTINSKVSYLKTLFNELIDREIISENPFAKIRKQKEVKSYQNIAYNDAEIVLLKNLISIEAPDLWAFIQFIFYGFLRPNEIRMLKAENINLKTAKIFVSASISKNGKEGYVDIPAPFLAFLKEYGTLKTSKGNIFTANSSGKPLSRNVMNHRHSFFIKRLKLDSRHTLYSWKHTGVVKAYKAGVDIKSIQRQCRHSSIEMTDNYLKSLGMYENEGFLLKMPEI